MTLFGFIGGKDMGPSINLVSSRLPPVWIAFTKTLTLAADRSELCMHFSKISMCFYNLIARFTFIFTNIVLIPHTTMFYRTRQYRSKKGS